MQPRADAMSHKIPYYTEAACFYQLLHRGANIANRISYARRFNPLRQRFLRHAQQLLQLGRNPITYRDRDCRIPVITV